MASPQTTETWDAAWTSTRRAITKEVVDNISDEYPLIKALRNSNRFELSETVDGGKQFQVNLLYALQTGEWFDGWDELANTTIDGVTAAFFTPTYLQVPLAISQVEETQNSGAHRVFSLLETKTKQAMQGAMSTVNAAGWGAQTGKAPLGLQDLVADVATNTVGGISRSTYTWWKNQTNASGGDFDSKSGDVYVGFASMGTMFNDCSEGNDKPTMIGTTLTFFGQYEKIMESTGYARTQMGASAKVSATNPSFRGAEVFYDRDCPSLHMYFINPKYLGFKIHKGFNFAKTPFQQAERQLGKFCRVVFGGQFVTSNPRRLGVIQFT